MTRAGAKDPGCGADGSNDESFVLRDRIIAGFSLQNGVRIEVAIGESGHSGEAFDIFGRCCPIRVCISPQGEEIVADLQPRAPAGRKRVAAPLGAVVDEDRGAGPSVGEMWRRGQKEKGLP